MFSPKPEGPPGETLLSNVTSTMRSPQYTASPQHIREALATSTGPLDWGVEGTEKSESMLDPRRQQGCQNRGRSEELRMECLWLRSRGQEVNGDVDKDSTVDQRGFPARSDPSKVKSCIC